MSTFEVAFRSLTEGFGLNCIIFAVTLLTAIPLGLIIAFGSMSKWRPLRFLERSKKRLLHAISKFAPIRWLTRTFVWIIRGTPLMLQIFVVLYAPGLLWDMPMRERMVAVLVAFGINYAAYFSEIYRGGIEAIPKGQYEACQVLGMTKSQTFFKVVLPQVVKRIIPPMGNEIITLVKDTSLARVVAVTEIIMCAERFTKQGLIGPLFSTALYFLAFNGILTVLFGYIEKKLDYYRG
ncbi:MAG: amino acid ABC transporter permease [Oscillospiraceae bacterium]|nr:amino acid ABC transporter permease [Oscillospiraceae bacterium]MBQ2743012.1 amino acid ABC transporter permease [Oscillospiraceae bacterium]MBQ3225282.1 amino acid ABC transporter permease [Oscillospiraceae bacterium]MBQ7055191.1 amino acid ABC transporter permease [Oscillospiraceae bacterium]